MKKTYPSRYSNGNLVTAAQYITELICEKKARVQSAADLPQHFWEQEKWAAYYRTQIVIANSLIRIYDPRAIIRALNNPSSSKCFSLRAPFLDAIIKAEQSKLKTVPDDYKVERVSTIEKPRPQKPVSNLLTKLQALDMDTDGKEKNTS